MSCDCTSSFGSLSLVPGCLEIRLNARRLQAWPVCLKATFQTKRYRTCGRPELANSAEFGRAAPARRLDADCARRRMLDSPSAVGRLCGDWIPNSGVSPACDGVERQDCSGSGGRSLSSEVLGGRRSNGRDESRGNSRREPARLRVSGVSGSAVVIVLDGDRRRLADKGREDLMTPSLIGGKDPVSPQPRD